MAKEDGHLDEKLKREGERRGEEEEAKKKRRAYSRVE